MNFFRNPAPKELENIVEKYWKDDSLFLHYTGHFFGIGCRLSSKAAIDKISMLKQRKDNAGYIVLIPDISWLHENKINVPYPLIPILEHYWPGNLTVVFHTSDKLFEDVSFNDKVAFRVPADYMLRNIIEILREPLISTSINISGVAPATTLYEIKKRYENWFDLGIIPQNTSIAEPSTIVEYIIKDEKGKAIPPKLKCIRESAIPFYEINQNFHNPVILFVCTGNICRSPIAEYLFNHYSKENNLSYVAKSAGLLESGAQISINSMKLLSEKGIDSTNHSSRKINPEIINESWLILTMEEYHKNVLLKYYPDSEYKIFTLKEYIGDNGDISDPIGNDLDYYRDIYTQIDEGIKKLISILSIKKQVSSE